MASALARTTRTTLSRYTHSLLGRTYTSPAASLLLRRNVAIGPTPTHQFLGLRRASTAASLKQSDPVDHAAADEAALEEEIEEQDDAERLPEFQSLEGSIHPLTLKALVQKPFSLKTMSPVQAEVLPMLPLLAEPYSNATKDNKRDLFVKARTGTGKTIAFLVPAIEARMKDIDAHVKKALADAGKVGDARMEQDIRRNFVHSNVGTLILSPTRELATQIAREAQKLTEHHEPMGVHLLVGGMPRGAQLRNLLRGRKDIIVATTGRLRDLMSEPDVLEAVSKTRTLVLDEADTLLDMGFRPDIDAISRELPPKGERQSFMFSATVPAAIKSVAHEILHPKFVYIDCVPKDAPVVNNDITMRHTVLPSAADQIPTILQMIAHDQLVNAGASKIVVFCNTTSMTRLLATMVRELAADTLPSARGSRIYEIHSKKAQDTRFNTSARFRADTTGCSVLITSDVSARGVDYPGVTRVIQVGIPTSSSQYVHRVGRTGRAGKTGRSDLILLPFEASFVQTSLGEFSVPHLSVEELQAQLFELCAEYDSNPTAFWKDAIAKLPPVKQAPLPRFSGRRAPVAEGPRMHRAPVTEHVKVVPDTVKAFLTHIDSQAIDETFMSSLGYYAGQVQNLRGSKREILDGLKSWAVDGCAQPVPPHVSVSFLNKVGFSMNERPGDRGRERKPHWGSPRNQGTYGMGRSDGHSGGNYRNRDFDESAMWGGRSRDQGSYGGSSSSYGGSSSSPRSRDSRAARRDEGGDAAFGGQVERSDSGSGSPFRLTTDRRVGQGRDEYKDRAKHHWKGRGKKGSKTSY